MILESKLLMTLIDLAMVSIVALSIQRLVRARRTEFLSGQLTGPLMISLGISLVGALYLVHLIGMHLLTFTSGPEVATRFIRTLHLDVSWIVLVTALPLTALGLLRDIEHRKGVEEFLRRSHVHETVGRLAGGIAHDFNNLLMVILASSESSLSRVGDDQRALRDLELIQDAAQRCAALTGQLLAFSQQQVLEPRAIDLNERIRMLLPILNRMVGGEIGLRTNLAEDLGAAHADPAQIDQVIVNLVVNAIDAVQGSGEIAIETANVDLAEAGSRASRGDPTGQGVMLSVRDDGIGMDADTVRFIFEPFFSTKGRESGLRTGIGLGLSTVLGIVEQSGGSISVDSDLGRGSIFRVTLSRVGVVAAGESVAAIPGGEADTRTETILVVEDDEAIRELIVSVLSFAGFRVLEASSSPKALEVFRRDPASIALVISDMLMPGMRGKDLVAQLRAESPRLEVIYMSGFPRETHESEGGLEAGHWLAKPFTPDDLNRVVRQALGRAAT